MNKSVVINGVIGLFFFIALFNVYTFFQERRQAILEQEAQRIVKLEKLKSENAEAERKATIQHEIELHNLALEKDRKQAELLAQKLKTQQRVERYHLVKDARRATKRDKRLQRRIDQARKLGNPEGLPSKIVKGIQSATYLIIRNNPEDYIGNYTAQSLLRTAKLTQGGADGLMLFSMLSNDLKAIQEVINIGHDVNTRNKSGYTALMFAGAYNTPRVVDFLVQSGADIKATDYLTEGDALHVAARYNPKPETIEAMVKLGFDLESQDKDGNTALLLASKYNQNLQVVEKLIELGANKSVVDKKGQEVYFYLNERLNERFPKYKVSKISPEYESSVLNGLK